MNLVTIAKNDKLHTYGAYRQSWNDFHVKIKMILNKSDANKQTEERPTKSRLTFPLIWPITIPLSFV